MADFSQFFVIVFSRTGANEIQIEPVMKALSEQHATSRASLFAGDGQGAVACSQSGDPAVAGGDNVQILARLRDVLPDGPNFWALRGTLGSTSVLANPLARTRPLTNTLRIAGSSIMLFAARQRQMLLQGSRLSRAFSLLVAVATAVAGLHWWLWPRGLSVRLGSWKWLGLSGVRATLRTGAFVDLSDTSLMLA